MANRKVKLVIDACVGCAASEHGKSRNAECCKDVLDAIQIDATYFVVFMNKLYDEWKKNRSRYGLAWLFNMENRNRIVRLKEIGKHESLEQRIINCFPKNSHEKIKKDFHLIEAALETDRKIISLDAKARVKFAEASDTDARLGKIIWTNPSNEDHDSLKWLREGANDEDRLTLGFIAKKRKIGSSA